MDGFLSFLSDLILFTAGLAVLIFWIVVLIAIAIEIVDAIKKSPAEDDDEFIDPDIMGPKGY